MDNDGTLDVPTLTYASSDDEQEDERPTEETEQPPRSLESTDVEDMEEDEVIGQTQNQVSTLIPINA